MTTQEIQNLIKELIEKTTVSVNEISISENGDMTVFSAEIKEPHLFTSRGGEGLSALNHLARRMIETRTSPSLPLLDKKRVGERSILIDINGFQKRRINNVKAIAHMMAERARYFKSSIEVDPMSAFERRIVHEFLSDATDLKTESTGEGLSRRVVIKYIGGI